MKLGLILECPKLGVDHQVYGHIISQLNSEIEILPSDARNKPWMIQKCGEIASVMLESEKCNKIVIIWDLIPAWGGKACRKEDVDLIIENLKSQNVDLNKIKLVCIEPELEAWLIVDGSALTKYKTDLCHPHKVDKFKGVRLSKNSNDSKKTISKYLERRYNDVIEAIRIAKNIDDFGKVARKHASFARLMEFIVGECSGE